MLHDPTRHEACTAVPWSEALARAAIAQIVADTEAHFRPGIGWPMHPRDREPGDDPTLQAFHALYHGSCGVIWALQHLQALGAVRLQNDYRAFTEGLLPLNRIARGADADIERASYLMGETPILMLQHALKPKDETLDALDLLIGSHHDHPARELMWGAPGMLLAVRRL